MAFSKTDQNAPKNSHPRIEPGRDGGIDLGQYGNGAVGLRFSRKALDLQIAL
jgi:hypothetical protein